MPPFQFAWDDPETARYYQAFCDGFDRYQHANRHLALHSDLRPGQRVLDVAAGLGHTAEAALPGLGEGGRVVCVEPAAAMKAIGETRLPDERVSWCRDLSEVDGVFDRVLCGAAIWLFADLGETLRRLSGFVAEGGRMAFTIPSLYLGIPDEAGGGPDARLLELPAALAREAALGGVALESRDLAEGLRIDGELPVTVSSIETILTALGGWVHRWEFRYHLTQACYREWLKIPVLTNGLLPQLDHDARARLIDGIGRKLDPRSWKWEGWSGWTVWKENDNDNENDRR